jgi:hypothetical protein
MSSLQPRQFAVADLDHAAVRPLEAGHHHQQRRFAGPGRPEHGNRFAARNIEARPVEDVNARRALAKRQVHIIEAYDAVGQTEIPWKTCRNGPIVLHYAGKLEADHRRP